MRMLTIQMLTGRKNDHMAKLRNSIITQILDQLERGEFCEEDFDVLFPDDSSNLAEIRFKPLPKFSFILDETYPGGAIGSALALTGQGNNKRVIRTTESPGEYKNQDTRTHKSIDLAIHRVAEWVGNIREDLIHSRPATRAGVDDFAKEFQESIDESINDPDSYFDDS